MVKNKDGYYLYHIEQQMIGGDTVIILHEEEYDEAELRKLYDEAKEEVLYRKNDPDEEMNHLFWEIIEKLEENFGFKCRDDRNYSAYIKVMDK